MSKDNYKNYKKIKLKLKNVYLKKKKVIINESIQ